MDITRNWRLKINRSQLLATRCPHTGAVMLPQQTPSAVEHNVMRYEFPIEENAVVLSDEPIEYVRAAR
ncbi:MAG: hypothetical protein Kow00106_21980 [Anaerolineae bacterium]